MSWPNLKKKREYLSIQQLHEDETGAGKDALSSIIEGKEQKWNWNKLYSPDDYGATFHLVTNATKRTFGDLFKRALSAVYITHCLLAAGFFGNYIPNESDLQYVAALALRHFQGCSCNAYEISEMQLNDNISQTRSLEVGGAVYPTISLTNHSCFPNVTRYNIGARCVLRATRLIPKGTEILDNYGFYFHSMSDMERKEALRVQYKFECTCDPCREKWPLYPHKQGEAIIFRCPGATCGAVSSYQEGRRLQCAQCGEQQGYAKLVNCITNKLEDYAKALTLLHDRKYEDALKLLLQIQTFFEPHAVYPAKHFTDVQEIIRQCFNCLGNANNNREA